MIYANFDKEGKLSPHACILVDRSFLLLTWISFLILRNILSSSIIVIHNLLKPYNSENLHEHFGTCPSPWLAVSMDFSDLVILYLVGFIPGVKHSWLYSPSRSVFLRWPQWVALKSQEPTFKCFSHKRFSILRAGWFSDHHLASWSQQPMSKVGFDNHLIQYLDFKKSRRWLIEIKRLSRY